MASTSPTIAVATRAALVALLACTAQTEAQTPAPTERETQPAISSSTGDSTATSAVAIEWPKDFPSKGPYKHGMKIEAAFDKFEERTVVTLEKLWSDTDGFINISKYKMYPSFSYAGATPPASPDGVRIEFVIDSSTEVGEEGTHGQMDKLFKFSDPEKRKLIFVLDGMKRVNLGSGEHDGGLSKRGVGSELFGQDRKTKEMVRYELSLSDWLAIANANLIEGRFGKKVFTLSKPEVFAALKDFTSRMRP